MGKRKMTEKELAELLETCRNAGYTWAEIKQAFWRFREIPFGTMYKIMMTQKVPKKWWKSLDVIGDHPPRISISKVDPQSAARSIRNNIPRQTVREIIDLLEDWC